LVSPHGRCLRDDHPRMSLCVPWVPDHAGLPSKWALPSLQCSLPSALRRQFPYVGPHTLHDSPVRIRVSLADLCGSLDLPIGISGKRHIVDNVRRPNLAPTVLLRSPTAVSLPQPPILDLIVELKPEIVNLFFASADTRTLGFFESWSRRRNLGQGGLLAWQ